MVSTNSFKTIIIVILSIIILVLVSGDLLNMLLNNLIKVEEKEMKRVTSPDMLVDYVLTQTNAGATTSFAYKLFLVPKGKKITKENEILVADHVDGLRVDPLILDTIVLSL